MTNDNVDPSRVVPIRGLLGSPARHSGTLVASETIRSRHGGPTAVEPSGPHAKVGHTTVALVKCTVSVSATLARLIAKSAAKESTGLAPVDALLAAAGLQAGELSALRTEVSRLSDDADRLRQQADTEHDQRARSSASAMRLQQELYAMATRLGAAEQQVQSLSKRNTELERALDMADARLAESLCVAGLDADHRAVLATIRDALKQGRTRFDIPAAELTALIANLPRPEMRALNDPMADRGWRLRIARWLLGARDI